MVWSTRHFNNFTHFMEEYEDPRTSQWFLVSNPFPTILICVLYVFCVNILGPKLMEHREPFHLRNILIGYNFFQMNFSFWLFFEFCASGWFTDYSFRCQPIDFSTNTRTMRMVNVTWWYFISKFTELFETVFFIMRKKFNQVNLLHVYHHAIMPLSGWLAVKYYPNGHGTFPGLLNTFVHIIMYAYYLLSACGPNVQKYLWWKKYLTALQMVQFAVIMVHTMQLAFSNCNFPRIFIWYMALLALSFHTLFLRFYNKSYRNIRHKHL